MARRRELPVVRHEARAGLGRRRVIQGLLGGAGAGLVVPGLAEAHPLREHAHHPARIARAQERATDPAGPPELLDHYQMGMLDSLAERVVPGAAAAGCARFIDSLLAVGEREEAQRFLTALGALDAEARDRFGRPWPELDETQQTELLSAAQAAPSGKPAPGYWTPGTPVADYLAPPVKVAPPDEPPGVTLRDHFETVKGWVVGAYTSSEAGMRELGYTGPYFGESFPGCTHPGGHR